MLSYLFYFQNSFQQQNICHRGRMLGFQCRPSAAVSSLVPGMMLNFAHGQTSWFPLNIITWFPLTIFFLQAFWVRVIHILSNPNLYVQLKVSCLKGLYFLYPLRYCSRDVLYSCIKIWGYVVFIDTTAHLLKIFGSIIIYQSSLCVIKTCLLERKVKPLMYW